MSKTTDVIKRDSKGRFVKGVAPNPKGRPKGSTNKTNEIKEMLEKFVFDGYGKFEEAFDRIKDDEKKARLYLEATKLILPKPKSVEEEELQEQRAREILDRIWPLNRDDD